MAEVLEEIAARLVGSPMPDTAIRQLLDGIAMPLQFVIGGRVVALRFVVNEWW